jgi:hypothetical protein
MDLRLNRRCANVLMEPPDPQTVWADLDGDGLCELIGHYEPGNAVTGLDRHFYFASDEHLKEVTDYYRARKPFILWWVTPKPKGAPYLIVRSVDPGKGSSDMHFTSSYSVWMWNPKSRRLAALSFYSFGRDSTHDAEVDAAMIAHYRAVLTEAEALAKAGKREAAVLYMEHARTLKETMEDDSYQPLWREFNVRIGVYGVDTAQLTYDGSSCKAPIDQSNDFTVLLQGTNIFAHKTEGSDVHIRWIDVDGDGHCDALISGTSDGDLLLLARGTVYKAWDSFSEGEEYVSLAPIFHGRDSLPFIVDSRSSRGATFTTVLRWNRNRGTFDRYQYIGTPYRHFGGGHPIAVIVMEYKEDHPVKEERRETQ